MGWKKKASGDASAKQDESKYCVLTLPLAVSDSEAIRLEKMFECGRFLFNHLLNAELKKYEQLVKTKKWKLNQRRLAYLYAQAEPAAKAQEQAQKRYDKLCQTQCTDQAKLRQAKKELNAANSRLKEALAPIKDACGVRNQYIREYKLSKTQFDIDYKFYLAEHRAYMPSQVGQNIAEQLWSSFEALLYGNGKYVHRKPYGELNTLRGKNPTTGIVYENGYLVVGTQTKLRLKVRTAKAPRNGKPPSSSYLYEQMMLQKNIVRCSIKRVPKKHGFRYFVQLMLEGEPVPKVNGVTGEVLHTLGYGDVGIDIGVSTVAAVGTNAVSLEPLSADADCCAAEIARVNKQLSNKFRCNNPAFYNEDGTVKRIDILKKEHPELVDSRGFRKWKRSNNYMRLLAYRRYLYQKQKQLRTQYHHELANRIVSYGNSFYIEKMDFRKLAKRAKETKKSKKGRFLSKKRFGLSIQRNTPASFVLILKNKVLSQGGTFQNINTAKMKASQYDHMTDTYVKKSLSKRWNDMPNGDRVQRDLYSAFLIENVASSLESADIGKCNTRYPKFLLLHK